VKKEVRKDRDSREKVGKKDELAEPVGKKTSEGRSRRKLIDCVRSD